MMAMAWNSDRTGERHVHLTVPLVLAAVGYAIMSVWHAPLAMIVAYLLTAIAQAGSPRYSG